MHVERVGAHVALQFDEVVAATQRAELGNATLRASLTAPRRLPRVIDGETVAFRARPVHPLAIVLGVVGGAAADDRLELLLRQALEPRVARFPWSKRHAPGHLPVEAQAILGRRRADGDIAGG